MNLFFSILSAIYIGGIFLFADSSVVSDMAAFNPYSLVHIPLYGILALLLILSFSRPKKKVISPIKSADSTNSTSSTNPSSLIKFFIPGIIAFVVAVTDEIHQAFIPTRNASLIDVILDIVGIILCLILIRRLEHLTWFSRRMNFLF